MFTQKDPLLKTVDGPGLLVPRLTSVVPRLVHRLRSVDTEHWLISLAESDPECIRYVDSESVLCRDKRGGREEDRLP